MENPLKAIKISSSDKKALLGGIASSLIYYGNILAQEQAGYPTELKQRLEPHLPSNGDLIAGLAPPLALYSIVKFGKKEKLRDFARGSILFGLPNVTARIICQSAYVEGTKVAVPARFSAPATISKYVAPAQTFRPATPSGLSKYAITG